MDTNSLIIWAIGAVLIAVGLPVLFIGRCLEAPEDKKKRRARELQGIALFWMAAGVIIYLVVLIRRFAF